MALFSRYFWFWCGAFWLVLVTTVIRRRLAGVVLHGQMSDREAAAFARGLAGSIALLCVSLGLISVAANIPSPDCIRPFVFDDPTSAAANVVTLVAWIAALTWVWLGAGADVLARVGPAMRNPPDYTRIYSPTAVRVVVTVLLAASAVGGVVGGHVAPRNPACERLTAPSS